MPVLDVRKLSKAKLTILGTAYDAVSKNELYSIAQLNADKVGHRDGWRDLQGLGLARPWTNSGLAVTRAGTVGRGHNFPAKPPATPERIKAVFGVTPAVVKVQVLLPADTTLTPPCQ
jgi:hypothetical protein